ncbi:phosphoribosylglycinamide formyltransferase [Nitrospira sp. Nam80]
MSRHENRFVFVVSTSGSVMNCVLSDAFLRNMVHSVVADQANGAIEKAKAWGVPGVLFDEQDPEAFCRRLADYMQRYEIDYVISFYTQFYSKDFRDAYADRIINFHPSLLPAFKGMDGFGDGTAYHAKIIGTTVEFIKDVMDEGKIIMQTACAVDPNLSRAALRHRIFEQQCKTLLQVVKWLTEDRVKVTGNRVSIVGARYHDLEFVPALEYRVAIELQVEEPSIEQKAAAVPR